MDKNIAKMLADGLAAGIFGGLFEKGGFLSGYDDDKLDPDFGFGSGAAETMNEANAQLERAKKQIEASQKALRPKRRRRRKTYRRTIGRPRPLGAHPGDLINAGERYLQWATNVYCIQYKAANGKHKHDQTEASMSIRKGEHVDVVCVCGWTIRWELKSVPETPQAA